MRAFVTTLMVGLLGALALTPLAGATEIDFQLDDIVIVGAPFETTQSYVPEFPILGSGDLDFGLGTGTLMLSDYANFIDLVANGVGDDAQLDIEGWMQTITDIDIDGNITSTGGGTASCTGFTMIGGTICGSVPPDIAGWPAPDGAELASSAVIDEEAQTITVIDNSIALAGTVTASYSYTIVPEPHAGSLGLASLFGLFLLASSRRAGRRNH
jgi:hypothetical protein